MIKPAILFNLFFILFGSLVFAETINLDRAPASLKTQLLQKNEKETLVQNEATLAEDLQNNSVSETAPQQTERLDPQQSLLEKSYLQLFQTEAYQMLENKPEQLNQFGYEFFNRAVEAGLNHNYRDLNPSFVLLEGDELEVATYGNMDLALRSTVDARGDIFFEKVGVISLKGLDFAAAEAKVKEAFQKYFLGSQVYVRLTSQIQRSVTVIGKVKKPGLQPMSGQTSLIEALMLAGGISKNGSLRQIEIQKGQETYTVDLYDWLLSGDQKTLALVGGETIRVPSIDKTVVVFGETLEPGIFEVSKQETLAEFLAKSQRFTPLANREQINIYRQSENAHNVNIHTVTSPNFNKTELKAFDIIQILSRQHLTGLNVTIRGAVQNPGSYQLQKNESLTDIIAKAGGLSRHHAQSVLVQRRLNQSKYFKLSDNTSSRVDYQILDLYLRDENLANFKCEAGDIIEIPLQEPDLNIPAVQIFGEIAEPGEYPFMQGMNIFHLLTKSGGITDHANTEGISISRMVAEGNIHIQLENQQGLEHWLKSTHLEAGDVVTVPTKNSRSILVTANGEFQQPGTYALPKGSKISDLIEIAGGLRSSAFPGGVAFYRESVANTFNQQIQSLADRLEEDMIRSQKLNIENALSSQNAKNAQIFDKQERLIQRLRLAKSPGRVAMIFPKSINDLAEADINIILENGDRLDIPTEPSTVNIIGQVYNPNTLAYSSQLNVQHYLNAAGGLTEAADEKNIYILKANGMITPLKDLRSRNRGGWLSGRSSTSGETFLSAGDTILVPEDFEIRLNKLQLTKDVSQIMFQIIGSLGVLVAAF